MRFGSAVKVREQRVMHYLQLVDTETSNVIGRYDSEQDALRLIQELLEAHGEAFVCKLQLGARDASGQVLPVVDGEELVRRARDALISEAANGSGAKRLVATATQSE